MRSHPSHHTRPRRRSRALHHPKHSIALADRCKARDVDYLLVLRKDTAGDRGKQADAVVGFLIEKLTGTP